MKRPDVLLFDLDGTLVDSRVPYTRSMNHALAAIGQPQRAPEDLYQYLGPPIHETLIDHLGVPDELVDRCITLYRSRYAEFGLEETTVFDGVPELLRSLYGRVPMAVATSKVLTLAEPLLVHLGLRDLFEVVAAPGPEAINESKSETIAEALAGLAALAGTPGSAAGTIRPAVMIGDRFYDVVGAHDHGIPTIGVLWGVGSEQELREAGAAALVNTPAEIPALLGFP
jgi:phosphoglycolate phosphatase